MYIKMRYLKKKVVKSSSAYRTPLPDPLTFDGRRCSPNPGLEINSEKIETNRYSIKESRD